MATVNAINYLKFKEDQRSNLAKEAETNRANLANESLGRDTLTETKRSNLAKEFETNRSNLAKEGETHRANVAKEIETNRHNTATETIDSKIGNSTIYKNQQQGNLLSAQTAKADMDNAEYAKLGYTGAGFEAVNKAQLPMRTLAEQQAKEAEAALKTAQASTESYKTIANITSSGGSLFRGLSGLLK